MNFWNAIVQSNTFNFAVLLLLFAVLYKKLNIAHTIDSLKQNIIKRIEDAKQERQNAKLNLTNATKSVENLENEINEHLKEVAIKADNLSEQIVKNAQTQIELIEKNAKNVILGEEKTLLTKINSEVLKASIDCAKEKIVKTLAKNPKLHDKFIEESIGEL